MEVEAGTPLSRSDLPTYECRAQAVLLLFLNFFQNSTDISFENLEKLARGFAEKEQIRVERIDVATSAMAPEVLGTRIAEILAEIKKKSNTLAVTVFITSPHGDHHEGVRSENLKYIYNIFLRPLFQAWVRMLTLFVPGCRTTTIFRNCARDQKIILFGCNSDTVLHKSGDGTVVWRKEYAVLAKDGVFRFLTFGEALQTWYGFFFPSLFLYFRISYFFSPCLPAFSGVFRVFHVFRTFCAFRTFRLSALSATSAISVIPNFRISAISALPYTLFLIFTLSQGPS
jgi:hypothetical protein